MEAFETVKTTRSVCPVCLRSLDAQIVRRGDDYYLEKTCGEHGAFSVIVWRGRSPAPGDWGRAKEPPKRERAPDCPNECGLCQGHLQKTCCALVEVTMRCGLHCPVCFAGSGEPDVRGDPSVALLYSRFKKLTSAGSTFVQLSGGEPTVRDDLPEIVSAAKKAGCEHIQLNSNGLRLASEPEYARALARAGLDFVFMQFDGTRDDIYEKLRGKPLLAQKKAAIDVCSKLYLGVTLVPTLVPGINDGNIGDILAFALKKSPAVRGVHFQPISYFGRYPAPPDNADRITLPEILRAIESQTSGKVKASDLAPSACDHPRCGFHGDFVVLPNMLLKLTKKSSGGASGCCDDAHLKNRKFVARRWKRERAPETVSASGGIADESGAVDMDSFLERVKSHGFTITCMAFQDAYNLDLERLRQCSLHVFDGRRTVPFCARYITAAKV
ncbi:MAG: radical SAM protein [Oscillospiraceae bacterium]|nr:radical SAM protein [Oscillospiraceae bacterium]